MNLHILEAMRQFTVTLPSFLLAATTALAAPECTIPGSGTWIVSQSCDVLQHAVAPADVVIENNSILFVASGVLLNVDLSSFSIEIETGSKLRLENGARIITFPVGQALINGTDGEVGYYLKQVDGPVVAAYRHTAVFYPASTIKVLEHLHAMRSVESGLVTLATTLNVCPSAGATNCTDMPNSASTCNDGSFCSSAGVGGSPNALTLQNVLQRMMLFSDNEATNALQELFGNGTPSAGRIAMNQTARNVVGMSQATQLNHKFACCNITNASPNQLTLKDVGLLYEQVAVNGNVLGVPAPGEACPPACRPTFYNLMLNETNSVGTVKDVITPIMAIVDQESAGLGLTGAQATSFKNMIREAHKEGCIRGRMSNCAGYVSIAGWVRLPTNGGAGSREYVYGSFIEDATTNAFGARLEPLVAPEMLRGVIRGALKTW